MDICSVTVTLYFPQESSTWEDPDDLGLEIAQVIQRMEESLNHDPSLGHRGLRAKWRGTDGSQPTQRSNAPPGYPEAVEVYLAVNYI